MFSQSKQERIHLNQNSFTVDDLSTIFTMISLLSPRDLPVRSSPNSTVIQSILTMSWSNLVTLKRFMIHVSTLRNVRNSGQYLLSWWTASFMSPPQSLSSPDSHDIWLRLMTLKIWESLSSWSVSVLLSALSQRILDNYNQPKRSKVYSGFITFWPRCISLNPRQPSFVKTVRSVLWWWPLISLLVEICPFMSRSLLTWLLSPLSLSETMLPTSLPRCFQLRYTPNLLLSYFVQEMYRSEGSDGTYLQYTPGLLCLLLLLSLWSFNSSLDTVTFGILTHSVFQST